MASGKYRRRPIGQARQEEGRSLKEEYGAGEQEELVVERRSVAKISRISSAIAAAAMAALALVGAVSLASPELRAIMADIAMEAVREVKLPTT